MALLTIIIANLIWIVYSLSEGTREGFYWHYENKCKRVCDFNVNRLFNLQRLLVLTLVGGYMMYNIGLYTLISLICMFFIFPFFHNGTYYYTRNKLDSNMYAKRWIDESKTFPVFSALTSYNKRAVSMMIGILAQVFMYLFLI